MGGTDRREAILTIAAELFARNGFTATTVRQIADEAGILSGSLYHHFDSKEQMVDEILSSFIDEVVTDFQAIVASVDEPRAALEALIRSSFEAVVPNRVAMTIALNESHHLRQGERFAYVQEADAQIEALWAAVIQQGIDAGTFRSDLDPALVQRFVRDAIGSVVRWYEPGGTYTVEQMADSCIALTLAGLEPQGSSG